MPLTILELGLRVAADYAADKDTQTATRTLRTLEVIKGDSQKADNAEVLDHLWLHAFVTGHTRACLGSHQAALQLPLGGNGSSAWEAGVPPIGWQGAMGRFRRGIVRGYTTWRQNNVRWQSIPTTAQMVRGRMAISLGASEQPMIGPQLGGGPTKSSGLCCEGQRKGRPLLQPGMMPSVGAPMQAGLSGLMALPPSSGTGL